MNTLTIETEVLIGQLLSVLRTDIEYLQQNLDRMDRLRELVIKREDHSLNQLLNEIRSRAVEYEVHVNRRILVRSQIGAALGWEAKDVRLSRLMEIVSHDVKTEIAELKTQLEKMAVKVQAEHASTVLLLGDMARFNRMLLNMLMGTDAKQTTTYDARGSARRQGNNAFVDIQF